jgi:hypothetical protein
MAEVRHTFGLFQQEVIMSSSDRAAVVFTSKSIEHMCSDGGSQSWRMHQSHFGTFDYLICTRNRRREDVEGPEEHGSAFLIGKVRDIVPATGRDTPSKPRFLIRMSEAAIIRGKPDFWQWGRWPTHYDSLENLGINAADYDFKPLPDLSAEVRMMNGGVTGGSGISKPVPSSSRRSWREAVEHAKASLAAELDLAVAAIEISFKM